MRHLFLFALLSIGFQSCAEGPISALTMTYNVDSVTPNDKLEAGHAQVIVRISNKGFSEGEKILYGYDTQGFEAYLNKQKFFEFTLDSGEHVFQFYPAEQTGYEEITTYNPIYVAEGTTTYMTLDFKKAQRPEEIHVRKPVVYLYPTEETAVSVSVKPQGEMVFTYPEYMDKWECTAFPSGEILIDENSYNYLFWEADQMLDLKELNEFPAILVDKDNLVEFLEDALAQFGFHSKEKMDFITYWAPEMIKHPTTEIRFVMNEDCALFADLEIAPKPDNLLRFYMIWNPTDEASTDRATQLEFPAPDRSGFTVLEWGGMEIPDGNQSNLVINQANELK